MEFWLVYIKDKETYKEQDIGMTLLDMTQAQTEEEAVAYAQPIIAELQAAGRGRVYAHARKITQGEWLRLQPIHPD